MTHNADRLLKPEETMWIRKGINVNSHTSGEAEKSSRSKVRLEHPDRFIKNIFLAKSWLEHTHSVFSQVNDFILRAKGIAIQMMDKAYNQKARKHAAKEVGKLLSKIQKTVSTPGIGRYSFAWNQHMTLPFSEEEGRVAHQEDTEKIELEIEPGLSIRINLVGSDFLTKPLKILGEDFDLDPGVDQNTQLSDLNGGRGVNLGSIGVRDNNARISWDINLHHATTIGEVISAINFCGIAGLSADISGSKKKLKLTYSELNGSSPGEEFTISEASGTMARDLGILSNVSGPSSHQPCSLEGKNLDPILTQNTPVSLLKSGHGLNLGTIKIVLGGREKLVNLSFASTVGEIMDAINNSIGGVVASINSSKRGISVESTVVGQSLVVLDADDKKSATSLGISGSPDIGGGLLFLMEVLNNGDFEAISKSLENLDLSLEEILSRRAEAEAKRKILENIEGRIRGFRSDVTRLLSGVSGVDLFQATTSLTDQLCLYQSALQSGAAMIQPTLLDFIR